MLNLYSLTIPMEPLESLEIAWWDRFRWRIILQKNKKSNKSHLLDIETDYLHPKTHRISPDPSTYPSKGIQEIPNITAAWQFQWNLWNRSRLLDEILLKNCSSKNKKSNEFHMLDIETVTVHPKTHRISPVPTTYP